MSADLNAIKALLAEHDYIVQFRGAVCICGHMPAVNAESGMTQQDYHRAHVAEVLAAHIAALIQALEEVRDLANGWLLLSATAMSEESREWTGASGRSVRAVLERRMGADWLNGRGESE